MAANQQVLDVLTTDHLHADLKGRSVRGGFWTLGSQGAQFVIQSVSTVVLARLLTPVDFGIVAMVTAVTGLGQAFSDLGLSEATIQRKEVSHEQVSMLFWINVAIGIALLLVTMALAPVLSWFYKEPRLSGITLLVSLTFLISGLKVQHDALLKRQMRFATLAIRDVASWAIAVPTSILLALRGAGYWALAGLPLMVNFNAMVLSWLMVRWTPGLPRRGTRVASMIRFGGNVAASYVIVTVNRSVANLLIGWHWGAGPLGLYSRAYNLLMLPVRQLSAPACSVAVPMFSRIQGDRERFARYYLRVANLIVWISTPFLGFLFVAAQPVIVVVLGRQWVESAAVFQILAVSALGQLLFESIIWMFISRGQSGRLLKLLLIISPIIAASLALGIPFGIKAVALSGSVVLIVIFPWILKFSFRGTDLTLRRLGRAIAYPISLCLFAVLSGEYALHVIAPQSTLLQLTVTALCFVAVYSMSVLIPPVRKEMMSLRTLLEKRSSTNLETAEETLESVSL